MLRLTTLGGLAIAKDGVLLDATGVQRRRLALLAVLACGAVDAPMSRDRLLALFWSERDEGRARNALKQLTFAIRRQFAAECLFLGVTELRLNPEVMSSDVGDLFDAAKRRDFAAVVALYAGQFLDGIHVSDAPELEQWVEAQRARIERLYHDARAALAAAAESRGDWSEAIGHWRALAARDPLDESTARRLVCALARSGDVAAALRCARTFEELLRDEVGVSVNEDFRAAVRAIRATREATKASSLATTRSETTEAPIESMRPAVTRRSPNPKRFITRQAVAVLAMTVLATSALFAIVLGKHISSTNVQETSPRRLVLLPFDLDASDSSLTFLRDGIPDLIDAALAGAPNVLVVDRHVVRSVLRDAQIVDSRNPPAIARILRPRLGAADIVAGTVVGSSRRLIINLRTVDAERGTELPAFRVTGPLDSLTMLSDRLAANLLTHTGGGPVDIDDSGFLPTWMSAREAASRQAVCAARALPVGGSCDQEVLTRSGVRGGLFWSRGVCGPDK